MNTRLHISAKYCRDLRSQSSVIPVLKKYLQCIGKVTIITPQFLLPYKKQFPPPMDCTFPLGASKLHSYGITKFVQGTCSDVHGPKYNIKLSAQPVKTLQPVCHPNSSWVGTDDPWLLGSFCASSDT